MQGGLFSAKFLHPLQRNRAHHGGSNPCSTSESIRQPRVWGPAAKPGPRHGGHFAAGARALMHAWWQDRLLVQHSQALSACRLEGFYWKFNILPLMFATPPPPNRYLLHCGYAAAVLPMPHTVLLQRVPLLVASSLYTSPARVCGPSYCPVHVQP